MSHLCCEFCSKKYKLRTNFNKHHILCEVIYRANRSKSVSKETEEVNLELPSPKLMYQMFLELAFKYNKLEEKVELMNKFVNKTKKKINVLEWLNNNSDFKPTLVFENLSNSIHILETDIQFLFNNNFYDLLNLILTRHIYDHAFCSPLFSFIQKPNTIYIYSDFKSDLNCQWIELSREKLIYFLNIIHHQIFKKFLDWRNTYQNKINANDELLDTYNKSNIKLMSIDFKHEPTLNKIKTSIYNNLKKDMKALIEFEFEF